MKKIIASLGLIILFSAFTTSTKAPPIVINDEFEFPQSYTTTNPCNGEIVTVTGMYSGSIHGVLNNNRTVSIFQSNTHLQGVGSLGNVYHVNSNFVAPFNGSLINGQLRASFSSSDLYISSGSAPNFKYTISSQTTVNANGITTVERFGGNLFEAECLGN